MSPPHAPTSVRSPESATHASSGHPRLSDSGETDTQGHRANHTLIREPATTSTTPIQNGMPSATPNRSVLEAVENSGVAYEPIASVSILPCNMRIPSTRSRPKSKRRTQSAQHIHRCRARVRQTVSRNEMDGPQYNGHTAEENRRAVVTAGQRRRKNRINRPNKGANKREHIR